VEKVDNLCRRLERQRGGGVCPWGILIPTNLKDSVIPNADVGFYDVRTGQHHAFRLIAGADEADFLAIQCRRNLQQGKASLKALLPECDEDSCKAMEAQQPFILMERGGQGSLSSREEDRHIRAVIRHLCLMAGNGGYWRREWCTTWKFAGQTAYVMCITTSKQFWILRGVRLLMLIDMKEMMQPKLHGKP